MQTCSRHVSTSSTKLQINSDMTKHKKSGLDETAPFIMSLMRISGR